MAEKTEVKSDALPDLDDLLQCPVCYEIPSGQIFQCNEGHHVCGRCKLRLDVCPVCRALFFGTRNYAMEELIANVKKLRAFKLGGKVTTGSSSSESNTPAIEENPTEVINGSDGDDEENNLNFASRTAFRPPQACKGLFRCLLCCKNGNVERLPSSRLLNHLRFYHAPELLEGRSANGEYVQAWQFSTVPGRLVAAIRVTDMGIFFLIIEICNDSVCAWLTMATAPWIAHEFCYTVTISGNDREAIFSDSVWSVRSCEGTLKKRGHCLVVNGLDARALVAPAAISGKLSVRRVPADQLAHQTQPRAVLRVASRGTTRDPARAPVPQDLEPFLQDLQNDVARLSRAFATLGREANALVRSEAEMRSRIENGPRTNQTASADRPGPRANQTTSADLPGPRTNQTTSTDRPATSQVSPSPAQSDQPDNAQSAAPMSRNARRRMRLRLRAALNAPQPPTERMPPASAQRTNATVAAAPQRQNGPARSATVETHFIGYAVVQEAPAPPPPAPSQPSSGTSNGLPPNGIPSRANKKKRRQRR